MIRARLTNGNYVFGLDAENIARLKAGRPIVVNLAELGGAEDAMVLIMYGDTLDDLKRELEEQTGRPLPPPTNQ